MTTRLLICFLYWAGDRMEVERLVRVACNLLEEPTDQAEIALIGRWDAPPPSSGVQYQASKKFAKVHVWTCDRKGEGFPAGCNEMAYGLLNWVLINRHMWNKFRDITGLVLLEGDCVITRRGWVQELCSAWEGRKPKTLVLGAVQAGIPEIPTNTHMNAVAIYDPEISRTIPQLIGGPQHIGWDNYHGPSMMPYAENSNLFKLDYRKPSITPEELFSEPMPLIYHGVKDDSAVKAVIERYKLDEPKTSVWVDR
jgi:hypothetical protein